MSLSGQLTDLGLGQVCGDERRDGVVETGGLLAGTEVATVVEIHSVREMMEASLSSGLFHLGEEFIFAMETALRVVPLIVGVVKFRGVEDVGGDLMLGCECEGGGQLGTRERG